MPTPRKSLQDFDKIFCLVASLLSVIALFTVGQILVSRGVTSADWADYYLIILLSLSTWIPIKSLRTANIQRVGWKQAVSVMFICFGFAALRYYFMPTLGVTRDQEKQFYAILDFFPSRAGAIQHQPPLDLIYQYFMSLLFGTKVWVVKFNAIFFSILASTTLFLLIWNKTKSLGLVLAFSAAYFFHSVVFEYSYVARPLATGLFFMILTGYAIDLGNRALAFSAALLSLLALGLQAPFYLLGLALFMLPSCKKSWDQLLAIVSAIVLFLPIQLFIFLNCPPFLGVKSGETLSFAIWLRDFIQYDTSTELIHVFIYPFLIIVLPLALIDILQIKRRELLTDWVIKFIAAITPLAICYVFMNGFNQWNNNIYYFVFFWPLSLILISDHIALTSQHTITRVAAFIALTAAILATPQGFTGQAYPQAQDEKELYEFLSSQPQKTFAHLPTCIAEENFACTGRVDHRLWEMPKRIEDGGLATYPHKLVIDWLYDFYRSPEDVDIFYISIRFNHISRDAKDGLTASICSQLQCRHIGELLLVEIPKSDEQSAKLRTSKTLKSIYEKVHSFGIKETELSPKVISIYAANKDRLVEAKAMLKTYENNLAWKERAYVVDKLKGFIQTTQDQSQ